MAVCYPHAYRDIKVPSSFVSSLTLIIQVWEWKDVLLPGRFDFACHSYNDFIKQGQSFFSSTQLEHLSNLPIAPKQHALGPHGVSTTMVILPKTLIINLTCSVAVERDTK